MDGSLSLEGVADHPAVEVQDLNVTYGSTPVLVDVGLTVPAGAGVCVTGENGIGKSTLLRCVSSLQSPDSGVIRVFGGEPGDRPDFWRAVATTVEPPTWYPGLTVHEHAELVCRAHGQDPAEAGIDEALERLGLGGHADAIPPSLSSGQKQRLTLALVLLRPSALLILDEPEQRLDPDGRAMVAGMLADYLAGGGSLLLASHDDKFAVASGAEIISMDML
ncbi:multidrug ABC transporter ATP-binding protein [Actinoplanes capillaceus]|uniref:Multidrug ABC transporter ATP-binding protein n=1 Tax=Actinoplanes campanulatus TaxID=113559 RepID=A0ABQ3WRR9_9ACTN|nr:ATP-binding cassette domain-containing protein [Actinoplanes capillaceus]GID48935.1 multidrug ABC transporter ATP-binding protein [Actinoplanes capillaceus]